MLAEVRKLFIQRFSEETDQMKEIFFRLSTTL
jgi:hypothetical protein